MSRTACSRPWSTTASSPGTCIQLPTSQLLILAGQVLMQGAGVRLQAATCALCKRAP